MRFSELDQLFACPGFTSIERDITKEDEQFPNAQTSREWGTMVHTWKETGNIVHPSGDKREEKLFGNRVWAKPGKEKINRFDYWPVESNHEVRVAYNWRDEYSVLDYAKDSEWYKRFDDDWIVGTIDTIWEEGSLVVIDDLKTGKWWNKTPTESYQVMGYGLGVQASGCATTYTKLRVTHWPKYPAKSPPNVISEIIPTEHLYQLGKKIKDKMEQRGQVFNPSKDNCRFCPGRLNCMFTIPWEDDDDSI